MRLQVQLDAAKTDGRNQVMDVRRKYDDLTQKNKDLLVKKQSKPLLLD